MLSNPNKLIQANMELSFEYLDTSLVGLLLAFLLIAIYFYFSRSDAKRHGLAPPEAGGAWPIIGHLHLLGKGPPELPHIILAALADKYGLAFTIRLGVHKALVVSSWELAKEIFTTHDLAVLSRPNTLAAQLLSYNYAGFGFAPYGPYWRDMRKYISVELLSAKRLDLLKHVRISETEISMKELYNHWKDQNANKSSSSVLSVEMKQWFSDLTLNVVLRMVVGKSYFGSVDVKDEKETKHCQKVMREFFYLNGIFVLADSVPYLRWLDFGGYEKKMKVNAQEMDQLVEGWLKEHRLKKVQSGGDHQDFMDVMMSLSQDADFASGFDADTITKATCLSLISGGIDTTVVMLIWALSLIMNHPQVLRKAQEELDLQVGKQRRVTESDITNLVYLQAIIKETLRLYPPGPLGGFREFSEDCTIGGYHVTKGTRLILHMWKIQRDPNVWGDDPSEFRPERFLTTHKHVDVKGYNFELIPFGAGRRICPGMNFGLQMLHLVLANLLHAFELSTPSNEPVDMTESAGLTNLKATPLQVLVAPRLSSHLY